MNVLSQIGTTSILLRMELNVPSSDFTLGFKPYWQSFLKRWSVNGGISPYQVITPPTPGLLGLQFATRDITLQRVLNDLQTIETAYTTGAPVPTL